jgi:hypothetical protein
LLQAVCICFNCLLGIPANAGFVNFCPKRLGSQRPAMNFVCRDQAPDRNQFMLYFVLLTANH